MKRRVRLDLKTLLSAVVILWGVSVAQAASLSNSAQFQTYEEVSRFETLLIQKLVLNEHQRILAALDDQSELAEKLSAYVKSDKGERIRYLAHWLKTSSATVQLGNYREMRRLLRASVAQMLSEIAEKEALGRLEPVCDVVSNCHLESFIYKPSQAELTGHEELFASNIIQLVRPWWFWEVLRPEVEPGNFSAGLTINHSGINDEIDSGLLTLSAKAKTSEYNVASPALTIFEGRTERVDFTFSFSSNRLQVDLLDGRIIEIEPAEKNCTHLLKSIQSLIGCAYVTGNLFSGLTPRATEKNKFVSLEGSSLDPQTLEQLKDLHLEINR